MYCVIRAIGVARGVDWYQTRSAGSGAGANTSGAGSARSRIAAGRYAQGVLTTVVRDRALNRSKPPRRQGRQGEKGRECNPILRVLLGVLGVLAVHSQGGCNRLIC